MKWRRSVTTRDQLQQRAAENGLHVAIDGPAGAGKSTVGRGLAERLGCFYLDTGLMYRALAWLARQNRVPTDDAAGLERLAHTISFALDSDGETLLVDG